MTREDILRMAKEAGLEVYAIAEPQQIDWSCLIDDLHEFAALVAAAEREACAKLCEEKETYGDPVQCWLDDCAASIRARGDK